MFFPEGIPAPRPNLKYAREQIDEQKNHDKQTIERKKSQTCARILRTVAGSTRLLTEVAF